MTPISFRPSPGCITPELALGITENIRTRTAENIRRAELQAGTAPVMAATIEKAAALVWKSPIWDASQRGNSNLIGMSVPANLPRGAYVWVFDPPYTLCENVGTPPLEWHGVCIFSDELGLFQIRFRFDEDQTGMLTLNDGFLCRTCPPLSVGDACPDEYASIIAGLCFLEMEFVGRQRITLPRHIRRAAEMKRRPELPEINTVTLRRTARDETRGKSDGEPFDYSCSWIVSGHWRNQWYPKAAEWKPKYIEPYLKGDPEKPLRQPKGTVYVVKR